MNQLKQNRINHVALVLDASSSMGDSGLTSTVIKVSDNIIKFLAKLSKEQDQETRITVYNFADIAECVIYDKDVLRLPSMAEYYKPYGWTALIDAAALCIDDLLMTPQKYGDHAFIVYVISDGLENRSRKHSGHSLRQKIAGLPDNWTLAAMVPNTQGKLAAESYGFPRGNIEIWDATSREGVEESGLRIEAATTSYMQARATGVRSTTNLFDIGANKVNAEAILNAGLSPENTDNYDLVQIGVWPGQVKPADWDDKKRRKQWKAHGGRIDEFVQNVNGGQYFVGQAYYQLVEGKRERIQPSKKIAVLNKKTDQLYTGAGARKLLGLPDNAEQAVKPTASDDYLIYVQSKSPNRLLVPGCRLLIFKR